MWLEGMEAIQKSLCFYKAKCGKMSTVVMLERSS